MLTTYQHPCTYHVAPPELAEKQKSAAGLFHTTPSAINNIFVSTIQIFMKKTIVMFHEIYEEIYDAVTNKFEIVT